jgi:hypothetical protein
VQKARLPPFATLCWGSDECVLWVTGCRGAADDAVTAALHLRKPVLHLPDIAREACTPLIGTVAKESSAAREAALLGRAERSSLKAA